MTGVVTRHQFVFGDDEFQNYINYMIRDEAVLTDDTKQIALFNDYIYKSYDNSTNHEKLFTEHKDALSPHETSEMKKCFQYAQKNGSCMWQDVISFDNQWLLENGLYNNENGSVDTYKLHHVTRKYMNTMLQNENLSDSAIWTASIHFNTQHTHIHIAAVEPIPTREKVTKSEYYGQMKGHFKKQSILKAKSVVINDIINSSYESNLINDIIRKKIIQGKKDTSLFLTDDALVEKFFKLHETLPQDKRLWKYNNNAMKVYRPLIDEITHLYIEQYHKEDFNKLNALLKKRENKYKEAYGKADKFGSYTEHKIKDLYVRMGNTILKDVKEYDKAKKKAFLERKKFGRRAVSSMMKWRSHKLTNSYLKRLINSMDDSYSHYKNQREFEEMEFEAQRQAHKEHDEYLDY